MGLIKTFPIRMSHEFYERVEKQAKRNGTSVTAFIRLVLNKQLEKDETTDPSAKPKKEKV